ncbi:MAG: hypothetical protein CM15mP49_09160 [Actinomycetota bacterium]|nr:MAG: hypothetical protein CM15mP49_09160 [Actinomycetota bacterium]
MLIGGPEDQLSETIISELKAQLREDIPLLWRFLGILLWLITQVQ